MIYHVKGAWVVWAGYSGCPSVVTIAGHMKPWHSLIDSALPYWQDYSSLLEKLHGRNFPDAGDLNALLPENLVGDQGHPIRFVPSEKLGPVEYERHIYTFGEVSTRESNWHDLFNALVWARLPELKIAMNSLHYRELHASPGGNRGRLRDALTLFDECGVIVIGSNFQMLDALSMLDWPRAFQDVYSGWHDDLLVIMAGHAMLEKCLEPYKSMTANTLLLHAGEAFLARDRESIVQDLDAMLATRMLAGEVLTAPPDLSPLPLMGIPGWWPHGPQNGRFYADRQVFRLPGERHSPAPIYQVG